MDIRMLVAYSLSSLGLFALVHRLAHHFKRRRQGKTYFRNKVVLITGASGGLGEALAEELYKAGAQLILCARRLDELNKVKENLLNLKLNRVKEPVVFRLDVTKPADTYKSQLETLMVKYGCVNILINNAGISYRGEAISTTDEVFAKVMEVNYFGVIRLTNLIVKQMIEDNRMCQNTSHRPEYAIVNIGSVQSILAIPYRSAYAASKHALMAYTDSLRYELHDLHANINAINVYPGYINTNISVNALRDDGNTNNENDDDHRHAYTPNYVAKRTIDSILNHDKEVFISVVLHRVAVWLRFFLPNFYHYLMFKRAASKAKANAKYA